jgi:hypothetical protein
MSEEPDMKREPEDKVADDAPQGAERGLMTEAVVRANDHLCLIIEHLTEGGVPHSSSLSPHTARSLPLCLVRPKKARLARTGAVLVLHTSRGQAWPCRGRGGSLWYVLADPDPRVRPAHP